jgi:large subunit ribosomal protein L4
MNTDARESRAHTKNRGEVAGTGKKPWAQKGTGRARHGSRRSPIWVGGGVAHGPRNEKNYSRKINKKMKTKALFTLLSKKLRDGEVLFIKNIDIAEPKTRNAKSVLSRVAEGSGKTMLALKKRNNAVIAAPELSVNVKRGFQNFGNLEVLETRNLNPLALANYKYIVIASPEASLVTLGARSAR